MNRLVWTMGKREGRAEVEEGGCYKIKLRKDGAFDLFYERRWIATYQTLPQAKDRAEYDYFVGDDPDDPDDQIDPSAPIR
jgi:hypothetical protein